MAPLCTSNHMTYSDAWHDSFQCGTLYRACPIVESHNAGMPFHSLGLWHDSFECMTHSNVWHDSSEFVTFIFLTHSYVSRYWFGCVAWLMTDSFSLGLLVAESNKAGMSFERFVNIKWFQNQLNFADVSIHTCIYRYKQKIKYIYVHIEWFQRLGVGGVYRMPTTHSCCNTLQHTAPWELRIECLLLQLSHTATRCQTLPHAATRCNTLHHAATRCNTLQHTATWEMRIECHLLQFSLHRSALWSLAVLQENT